MPSKTTHRVSPHHFFHQSRSNARTFAPRKQPTPNTPHSTVPQILHGTGFTRNRMGTTTLHVHNASPQQGQHQFRCFHFGSVVRVFVMFRQPQPPARGSAPREDLPPVGQRAAMMGPTRHTDHGQLLQCSFPRKILHQGRFPHFDAFFSVPGVVARVPFRVPFRAALSRSSRPSLCATITTATAVDSSSRLDQFRHGGIRQRRGVGRSFRRSIVYSFVVVTKRVVRSIHIAPRGQIHGLP